MCCYDETPEFEIRIKGHSLVQVSDGGVRVDGKNFHTDLKDLSSIVDVLNDILESANEAKKPKLVMNEPIVVSAFKQLPPFKAANNQ
jgi:hypothetical protein